MKDTDPTNKQALEQRARSSQPLALIVRREWRANNFDLLGRSYAEPLEEFFRLNPELPRDMK